MLEGADLRNMLYDRLIKTGTPYAVAKQRLQANRRGVKTKSSQSNANRLKLELALAGNGGTTSSKKTGGTFAQSRANFRRLQEALGK